MKKTLQFIQAFQNMNIKRFFSTQTLMLGLSFGFLGVWGQPVCPKTVGAELVTNGGFGAGNTGFTSGYTYSAGAVGPGQYTIGTNPNVSNSYFANIGDHTATDNNMLIMDVDATVGKNVYTTTVNVVMGRTYFFSAWFANINTNTSCATCSVAPPKYENAPQLRFSIEGVTVGNIVRVDSTDHAWTQFNTSWTALSTGPINISIQNLRNLPNGNDLALDDISFKAGCDGITDLSALGKASRLIDTVFTCNENFAFDLKTQLTDSKYNFEWYNGTSKLAGNFTPNANQDVKFNTASDIYSINPAPANGTKYYVCYDSLQDGVVCPRLDSVLFLNRFDLSLGPDRLICPPVSEVLNPSLTTTNIKNYKYERTAPTLSALTSGVGPGVVPPLTVTKAGTYTLTVEHNDGVCGTKVETIKIDTVAAAFTGGIVTTCNSGAYVPGSASSLTPKISGPGAVTIIGGLANVSWYTQASGGSLISGPTNTADGAASTTSNLVVTASCPQGGLFLQDNNSFATTITAPDPCPATAPEAITGNRSLVKIRSAADFTLKSLDIYTKANNGAGESINYQILVYNSLPANLNTPGPAFATGPVNKVQVTTDQIATKEVHTIIGPNTLLLANTDYYISVIAKTTVGNNDREIGFKNCAKGAGSNYIDNSTKNIINLTDVYKDNVGSTVNSHGPLFNMKFQVGNPSSCGRVFICASCTAPVSYTYFNVYPTADHEVLITWGTANETKNKKFVIEASNDGVNFKAIGEKLGSNTTNQQRDYSFVHYLEGNKQYYRIKQVDHDGTTSTTAIKYVSLNGSDAIGTAYPQPIKQGETLHIEVNGLVGTSLALKLVDLSGALVAQNTVEVPENGNALSVSTTGLQAGVYLLTLSNADLVKTIRVVVE